MTYNVFLGTLNLAQPTNLTAVQTHASVSLLMASSMNPQCSSTIIMFPSLEQDSHLETGFVN